jgi:uncharacterized membrane protein
LLFLIGILPALVWSLLKEKRFVKRNNLFAYGLLAIIFGAVETYGVPIVDANLREALLLFFIVGVVSVLIAFYTKDSRNMLFGFKSIAAFEIPVMLYLYSVVVTEWNEVFWAGVMLFFVFNAYSYLTRKASDRPYRKLF